MIIMKRTSLNDCIVLQLLSAFLFGSGEDASTAGACFGGVGVEAETSDVERV